MFASNLLVLVVMVISVSARAIGESVRREF